jgi:hypothetical protein
VHHRSAQQKTHEKNGLSKKKKKKARVREKEKKREERAFSRNFFHSIPYFFEE